MEQSGRKRDVRTQRYRRIQRVRPQSGVIRKPTRNDDRAPDQERDGWTTLTIRGVQVPVHVENGSFEEGFSWRFTNDRTASLRLIAFGYTRDEARTRFRKLVEEMVAARRLSPRDLR